MQANFVDSLLSYSVMERLYVLKYAPDKTEKSILGIHVTTMSTMNVVNYTDSF